MTSNMRFVYLTGEEDSFELILPPTEAAKIVDRINPESTSVVAVFANGRRLYPSEPRLAAIRDAVPATRKAAENAALELSFKITAAGVMHGHRKVQDALAAAERAVELLEATERAVA